MKLRLCPEGLSPFPASRPPARSGRPFRRLTQARDKSLWLRLFSPAVPPHSPESGSLLRAKAPSPPLFGKASLPCRWFPDSCDISLGKKGQSPVYTRLKNTAPKEKECPPRKRRLIP